MRRKLIEALALALSAPFILMMLIGVAGEWLFERVIAAVEWIEWRLS